MLFIRIALSFFFFFFSSRRRHTRSDRDWSSDVCSSDLAPRPEIAPESIAVPSAAATAAQPMVPSTRQQSAASSNRMDCSPYPRLTSRSEEHTSELQSRSDLVCRLLLEKKKGSSPGHT